MLPLLLAAAILQADPTAATAPTAVAPTAPAPTVTAPDASVPPAEAASPDGTPRGAPAGNYAFVAWCHGALAGHMALYNVVKPELVSIEQPAEKAEDAKNDLLQIQAGRDYLTLYTRALNNVDRGRPGAFVARRKAAEAQGAAIWDPYKDAAPRARMWAWVGWDLPGRCETASKLLLTPSGRTAALKAPAESGSDVPGGIDAALAASPADAQAAAAPPQGAPPPAASAEPSLRGPQ